MRPLLRIVYDVCSVCEHVDEFAVLQNEFNYLIRHIKAVYDKFLQHRLFCVQCMHITNSIEPYSCWLSISLVN
jgi:hypothetical protein